MSGTLQAWQASVKGILAGGGVDPTGLVAAYPFRANSAGDHSGSGFDGTLVGDAYVDDGGLQLDGTEDYVDLGNDASLDTQELTVSFWFNANSFEDNTSIISKGSAVHSGGSWQFRTYASNHLFFFVRKADDSGYVYPDSQAVAKNQWIHILATIDSDTNIKLYTNGVFKDSTQGDGIYESNTDVQIGNHPGGTYFNGQIDEVMIFNKALTPTEITALNNLGRL